MVLGLGPSRRVELKQKNFQTPEVKATQMNDLTPDRLALLESFQAITKTSNTAEGRKFLRENQWDLEVREWEFYFITPINYHMHNKFEHLALSGCVSQFMQKPTSLINFSINFEPLNIIINNYIFGPHDLFFFFVISCHGVLNLGLTFALPNLARSCSMEEVSSCICNVRVIYFTIQELCSPCHFRAARPPQPQGWLQFGWRVATYPIRMLYGIGSYALSFAVGTTFACLPRPEPALTIDCLSQHNWTIARSGCLSIRDANSQ